MTALRCHACGTQADGDPREMRAVCRTCGAYLHCCRNCALYAPGRANDCGEPQAERVADKTAGNFCDWFRPSSTGSPASRLNIDDARAALDRLFVKKLSPTR